MPETDVMPPVGAENETDEQRRQRLLPNALPPASIGPAPAQNQVPTAHFMPPAGAPAQPSPMAAEAAPTMPEPVAKPMPPALAGPSAQPVHPGNAPMPPSGPAAQRYQDLSAQGPPKLPWWKQALDVIGSIHPLGREIEANIPGSPQNYSARMNQAAVRATKEQELEKGQQEINAAPGKADLERRNIESEITTRGDKDTSALAKIGLTRDKDGNVVADQDSPVFKQNQDKNQRAEETEKSLVSYRQTQMDLNEARTAVERAKNDPNSPAYKQAAERLAMAQQAHAIAAQNLGLHEQEFQNRLQEQELIKPSGQAQSRASAAQATLDVMPSLAALVRQNGAQMGAIMGRLNKGELTIGNVDPEVAKLYAAMKSFYALQPAVHGFRNAEFVKDFETAIGTLERDPAAFLAGMEGLKPTMEAVAKEGKTSHRRIVEGRPGNGPAPQGGGTLPPGWK